MLSAILSAVMIAIGLVLLLPGMCAGFFLVASLRDNHEIANFFAPLIIYGFALSAGGVVLIVLAVRLLRSSRN